MALAYLDVDDEITSAAGRIRSAQEREVALVLPAGSRLGTSRINFRLLAREASAAGRDLAIVSPEPATRSLAASAGLPAYATVVAYEDALASTTSGTQGDASPLDEAALAAAGSVVASAASTAAGTGRSSVRTGAALRGSSTLAGAATSADAEAGARDVRDLPTRRNVDAARIRPRRGALLAIGGLVALVLLAAAAAVVALYVLPSATVRVVVQPTDLAPMSMTITADPAAAAPDPGAGVVPAERRTFPLTASRTFAATGKKVTETKATGVVRWENCDPTRSYAVPAGTTVRTKTRVEFTTDETVFLPVAILSGNPITISCQTRDVGVTAANPGTDGNVAAGAISAIPTNYNSVVIRVANPAETTGGTHVETTLVAKKDVDAALKKLNTALDSALAAGLKDPTLVGATGTIFPETASRTPAQADQDTTALVGQETASFELALSSTASVLAVDTSLVSTVAEQQLRASVPSGEDLLAGSTHVEVGTGTVADGKVTFPATATARVVRRIDPATVHAAVRGKSLADARAALASFGDATVTAWPDWISTVPTDDSRVTIDISYAGGPIEQSAGTTPGATAGTGSGAQPGALRSAHPSGSSPASPSPSGS